MKRRLPLAALATIKMCLVVTVSYCSANLTAKPAEGHRGVPTSPCTTTEANPVVEIVRSGNFNGITADSYAKANYNDFIGTISNSNFYRFWDGTCGSYKVPVRIVAPKAASCDAGLLANLGLIEIIHPNYIGYGSAEGFEGRVHGWNDPVYDPLLDQGFHEAWANLRVPFLFGDPDNGGSGAVYVGFQANNFHGELDYIASLPENQGLGLHLDRPQDYAFLYRDVSKWLRQAKTGSNFVNAGGQDMCPISDVIGFGYSYTTLLAKALTADPEGLNSAWGKSDPIFPRGRVMEGMLLGGFWGSSRKFGESCTRITASDLISMNCDGPDHIGEGPMVLIESEADIQLFTNGARLDPRGNPRELDHYRVHEINSTSHFDATYVPFGPILEFFGIDPLATRQNPLDRSPVFRADLVNLLDKIRNDTPLPPSSYMKLHGAPKSSSELNVILLNPSTGNGFGGLVLPQAAAPLGLYRGTECHGASSSAFDITNTYHYALPPLGSGDLNTGRANYVLESSPKSPTGKLCNESFGLEGLMTPYSIVDAAIGTRYCQSLYPTRQAYSNRVIAAADDLIARRLLLPSDRAAIIAAAEAQADLSPQCVPPRN